MTELARAHSISLAGLDGTLVEVQTHIGPGLVGTTLVGLPDASLREAKERVRAAMFSCGISGINQRITVNLSPADLPKAGSGFDLAIAVSILIARGYLPGSMAEGTVFIGELGLDGSLQPIPGGIAYTAAAEQAGCKRIVLPSQMAAQARLLGTVEVISCHHLQEILTVFAAPTTSLLDMQQGWELLDQLSSLTHNDSGSLESAPRASRLSIGRTSTGPSETADSFDRGMSEVRGQAAAIESLAIAASGGHHVILTGAPGIGKTMMALRMSDILPDLSRQTSLQATALRSLLTKGSGPSDLIQRPPLEQPHHSASMVSLIGGGTPVRPGSVSLAHGGLLVLDEAPEFDARTLDALRQPLEQGEVSIHRAHHRVRLPARFQMVMTANPCPCGGDSRAGEESCRCSFAQKSRYWSRLSGPLMDRIDVRLSLVRPHRQELLHTVEHSTEELRSRVTEARSKARERWKGQSWALNSHVPGSYLRGSGAFTGPGMKALEQATELGIISLRGADRVLRLSWSVADWEGHESPTTEDVARAFEMRGQEERTK